MFFRRCRMVHSFVQTSYPGELTSGLVTKHIFSTDAAQAGTLSEVAHTNPPISSKNKSPQTMGTFLRPLGPNITWAFVGWEGFLLFIHFYYLFFEDEAIPTDYASN